MSKYGIYCALMLIGIGGPGGCALFRTFDDDPHGRAARRRARVNQSCATCQVAKATPSTITRDPDQKVVKSIARPATAPRAAMPPTSHETQNVPLTEPPSAANPCVAEDGEIVRVPDPASPLKAEWIILAVPVEVADHADPINPVKAERIVPAASKVMAKRAGPTNPVEVKRIVHAASPAPHETRDVPVAEPPSAANPPTAEVGKTVRVPDPGPRRAEWLVLTAPAELAKRAGPTNPVKAEWIVRTAPKSVAKHDIRQAAISAPPAPRTPAPERRPAHVKSLETANPRASLSGEVQTYRNAFRLRYAPIDQPDIYGGVVVLEGSADLSALREGKHARVTGVLIPPTDGRSVARYRVTTITIFD